MGNERGNASLTMLGLSFGILFCSLVAWVYIGAHVAHREASLAADAGALAASRALEEAFLADIAPEAYYKLERLTQKITQDALYNQGDSGAAIIKHTQESKLREELLAGKRGQAIDLGVLLEYKPFFSERDLGIRLAESFRHHLESRILPEVIDCLLRNNANPSGEIAFPVYDQIEIQASKDFRRPVLSGRIGEQALRITGRGHALVISILDERGIAYDLSGVTVFRKQF